MTDLLQAMFDRQPWMKDGACNSDSRPDHWYASEAANRRLTPMAIRAIKICRTSCPVKSECLEYAFANREQHGIWGGTTPYQRQRMKDAI